MARAAGTLALALALELASGTSAKILQFKDVTNCSLVADALAALGGTVQSATKTSAIGVKATFDCDTNITCDFTTTFVWPTNSTKNNKQPKVVIDLAGGSKCKSATTAKTIIFNGGAGFNFNTFPGPVDFRLTGLKLVGAGILVDGNNGTKGQRVTIKDVSISGGELGAFLDLESLSITGGTMSGGTSNSITAVNVFKSISIAKTSFSGNAQSINIVQPSGKAKVKLSGLTFTGTTASLPIGTIGYNIQVRYAGDKVDVNIPKVTLDAGGGVNRSAICISSTVNATKPLVKISGNISPAKADKKAYPVAGWPVPGPCNVAGVGKAA